MCAADSDNTTCNLNQFIFRFWVNIGHCAFSTNLIMKHFEFAATLIHVKWKILFKENS